LKPSPQTSGGPPPYFVESISDPNSRTNHERTLQTDQEFGNHTKFNELFSDKDLNDDTYKHNFTRKKNEFGDTQVEQVEKGDSTHHLPKFGNLSNNRMKNLMSDISDITGEGESRRHLVN
jgi:hypothetical protein